MKILKIILFCLMIMGCSIHLTKEGGMVRLVSEQERNTCEFIGVVTGSMSMGASSGHDAESAMNEIRNRVAKLGGNGLRVINTDSDVLATTVTGEALKCNFNKP